MLFMPKFDCPSGVCRLKIEYAAAVKDRAFSIRFKPATGTAWDVTKPQVGPAWQTRELVVDLKEATAGYFEFHSNDGDPTATVRIRAVTVTEVGGSSVSTPATSGDPSNPSGWQEGSQVYRLDLA